MLLSTLGATLLGNLLAGKGIVRASAGKKTRERNCKCWQLKTMGFLMPPHPLANFEIQNYFQNEPRFSGLFSRINLPKTIKVGAYWINLDEYADVGTHWIVLFCNRNDIYFNSFGVEQGPEKIKKFVGNKNIIANIFQVQANDSVMCGYFCIGFFDFMLAGKKLTDYTSLFSPYEILFYFKNEWK